MNELRVPKRKVEVELCMPGVGTRRMEVYLSEFASTHEGPESVADLLNGKAEFIPALDLSVGRMTIVHRNSICLARVSPEHAVTAVAQLTIPLEFEVSISLTDGQTVVGLLSYVMPSSSARPVDFLNDEAPLFFPLIGESNVAFVNKRQIARVEIITE